MRSPPRAPALKSEMLGAAKLVGDWTQAHPPGDNSKTHTHTHTPQRLIAYFPLFREPSPATLLPSTLCAGAWHLGPFVVLIETETCSGPGVCCFNSTVGGFFFFFFFVCFTFLFSLPKPCRQCVPGAEAVCWALRTKLSLMGGGISWSQLLAKGRRSPINQHPV